MIGLFICAHYYSFSSRPFLTRTIKTDHQNPDVDLSLRLSRLVAGRTVSEKNVLELTLSEWQRTKLEKSDRQIIW